MKKLTIDFDGTLCVTAWPKVGKRRLIHKFVGAYVRHLHKKGWFIILNTLRQHENGTLAQAIDACDKWDIPIMAVNANYQPDVIEYKCDTRKIGSHLNIDDKNLGLIGWTLRRCDK